LKQPTIIRRFLNMRPLLMKSLIFSLTGIAALTLAYRASAQAQLSSRGFTEAGAFRLTVSGAGEVEFSADLQTWSRYASVTQPTELDDLASRQLARRFYRVQGGPIMGYVKDTIPAGKMAVLGNSFGSALRLDTPEGRDGIFGVTNPSVKVFLYVNGNFVPHTFDAAAGKWEPALGPIRPQEGFAVQNSGSSPITVRMSGVVRQGRVQTTIPAGMSLFVSPFPNTSPAYELFHASVPDGTQVSCFNEAAQKYDVSAFTTFQKPGNWEPKLPNVPPGRAVIVKAPHAIAVTATPSAR
jgi:hypothetical protein